MINRIGSTPSTPPPSGPRPAPKDDVQLLQDLRQEGYTLVQPRHFLWVKWTKALEPKAAAHRIEADKCVYLIAPKGTTRMPLSGAADLRALDAILGSGNPDGSADPTLAAALHLLKGQKWTAHVSETQLLKARDDYGYGAMDVGPYGAYLALTHRLSGLTQTAVASRGVADRQAVLDRAFFEARGSADGLADAPLADAVRQIHEKYPLQLGYSEDVESKYEALARQPAAKRLLPVTVGGCMVSLDDAALKAPQATVSRLDVAAPLGKQLGSGQSEMLQWMWDNNHLDAEHATLFTTVAAVPGVKHPFGVAKALAAIPGAATEWRALVDKSFKEHPDLAADVCVALHSGTVDKPDRFVQAAQVLGDVAKTQQHWSDVDGDAVAPLFEDSLKRVHDLGLDCWLQIHSVLQPADDRDQAVACYKRLQAVRNSDAPKGLQYLMRSVETQGPADVPLAERRERCTRLMEQLKSVPLGEKAWDMLSGAKDRADLEARQSVLERVIKAVQPQEALEVMTTLEQSTKKDGGLFGADATRLLQLVEATGSWKGAHQALDMLSTLPSGYDLDAAVGLFSRYSVAVGKKTDAALDGLHFAFRYAPTPQDFPDVAKRFADLIERTAGNDVSARNALQLEDTALATDTERRTRFEALLALTHDTDSAWHTLAQVEASGLAPQARLTTLQTLAAKDFKTTLTNAQALWDKATPQDDLPAAAAALKGALAKDGTVKDLLTPGPTLAEATVELQTYTALAEKAGGYATLKAWPGLRQLAAWVPLPDLVSFATSRDKIDLTTVTSLEKASPALRRIPAAAVLPLLGPAMKALGNDVAVSTASSIADWAETNSWGGGAAADHLQQWLAAAEQSGSAEIAPALARAAVPVGRESLADREAAMHAIAVPLKGQVQSDRWSHNSVWTTAVSLYNTVATDLQPGQSLLAQAQRIADVASREKGFNLQAVQKAWQQENHASQ